ncbi:MAG: TetR/AcrR family transcriptional regulator, partial [Cyanobacteria bacterium P01_A01_bin.37]
MNRSASSKSVGRSGSHKSDKAETILSGALEVFTTYGYAAASMDRIAAAAGVSKPTLYSYFQDKEGLFVALVKQLMKNSEQLLFRLPDNPEMLASPAKVLHQMATSVLNEASQNQSILTLMRLVIGESGKFPELAQTFIREAHKPLLENLAHYLAAQSQLQFPDPMVAARIFAGSLIHYLIVQEMLHGRDIIPLERDRMVNGLVDLMVAAGSTSVPSTFVGQSSQKPVEQPSNQKSGKAGVILSGAFQVFTTYGYAAA